MVDAGGLNPPGAKALYRFESDPGHINLLSAPNSFLLSVLNCVCENKYKVFFTSSS